jgi:hypothetical protein
MNDVIERLERLSANAAAGNWMDVVTRAERQRSVQLRRRVLFGVAALVLLAAPALALAYRFTDVLVVSSKTAEPPAAWIAGDRLHNLGELEERRLAAPLNSYTSNNPLFLFNTSVAIASPDDRVLLYRATAPPRAYPGRSAMPVLRLHELDTGRDRILEHGAASFAWRGDGVLAYAKATIFRPGDFGDPIGHVLVRRSVDEPAVPWTTEPARYTVLAWAGERLLVAAIAADAAAPAEGVYAFTGPGQARKLPIGGVIAVDPSGEFAVGPVTMEPRLAGSLTFRVVRLGDGEVLAELDLPSVVDPAQPYAAAHIATGGSWASSYIAVALASDGLESSDALVVLRFDGDELEPAHVYRLEPSSAAEAGFGSQPQSVFHSPRFLDEAGSDIVAWAGLTTREGERVFVSSVFLRCDREERSCERTSPLPGTRYEIFGTTRATTFPAPRAFVENPSRPLAD